MSDQGKANYEAIQVKGCGTVLDVDWDDLTVRERVAFDAGADAVEQWLAAAPVDEDAPGSEPQPAKVIVVTEVPTGDAKPVQRRYTATQWDDSDYSRLRLIRSGQPVGTYAGGAWLSVREEGAIANDGPADKRKLAIALDALRAIGDRFTSDDLDEDLCRVLDKIAADALGEIAELDL